MGRGKANPRRVARQKCGETKNTHRRMSRETRTPHMLKLREAQKHFYIQEALGRPIKKYNVIVERDEGDLLLTQDSMTGGGIEKYMRHLQLEFTHQCNCWWLMYQHTAKVVLNNHKKFYLYICLSHKPVSDKHDRFEYYSWTQE